MGNNRLYVEKSVFSIKGDRSYPALTRCSAEPLARMITHSEGLLTERHELR